MNCRTRNNNVDDYLSLRRIFIITLMITFAYYFLYILNHYFGRPSFANTNNREAAVSQDTTDGSAGRTIRYNQAQNYYRNLSDEELQDVIKERKTYFVWLIVFNIPLTFIMVFAVFLYCRKIMSLPLKRRSDEVVAVILGALLITLLLSTLCTLLQLHVFPERPGPPRTSIQSIKKGYLGDLPLTVFVIMACYLMRSLYKEKTIAVENETLMAENLRTRYEALKNQLDPHFLFNSLNTLQSLIEVDTDKAKDFVQQLSSVLRYTLQNKEVVTLAEELECVRAYCVMMSIRFGDNLKFDTHVNRQKYDNYWVLPLSIQGLVENAIKHNVISTKHPLTIRFVTDDNNHIIISNKIQHKLDHETGSGVGLANLVERYRLKWNENVEILDDGNDFTVILPLKEHTI